MYACRASFWERRVGLGVIVQNYNELVLVCQVNIFGTTSAAHDGRDCQVELLLVSQDQVTASETPTTTCALKRFLICVRAFMTFQMLQTCEGSSTDSTSMRTRLVSLDLLRLFGDRLERCIAAGGSVCEQVSDLVRRRLRRLRRV